MVGALVLGRSLSGSACRSTRRGLSDRHGLDGLAERGPEEVDNEITDRLEDAVSAVSGIRHISSQSLPGRSQITIEFQLEKNVDVAAQEVRDKVSARLRQLPDDAEVPVVDKQDLNAQPILWLA
jgi:HAE1 family hydrophobic/amphiphilic exporter-1